MRQYIYDSCNSVMNAAQNPLKNIQELNTRHIGRNVKVFGITAIAHVFILAAVVLTVATFETARQRPDFFVKFPTSTPSRSRNMYWNGQKIELDPQDKGGEHE